MSADSGPVLILKGSDEVLLAEAAVETIRRIVGDSDANEVMTDFSGDDYLLGDAVTAAATVSMFGPRIVVARQAARFTSKELAPVLQYLEDPSPENKLVLVWSKPHKPGAKSNALPKKLSDAVKGAGGMVIDTSPPRDRTSWIDDRLRASQLSLDGSARSRLVDQIGDDIARLGGIITVLEAVFGDQRVGADDIEPYLGGVGTVPPWDLTDAIDKGDVPLALDNLSRMLAGGARHPLQVMVTLQSHIERMVRLDGAAVRTDKEAATLLGMKGSTFPAKKALASSNRMGHDRLVRAMALVAAADVDLKGRTKMPATSVLEVLVARLAALNGGGSRRRPAR